jgi:hypothetical protein
MKPRHFIGILALAFLSAVLVIMRSDNAFYAVAPLALGGLALCLLTIKADVWAALREYEDQEQMQPARRG